MQPIADALKLLTKEIIQPSAASKGLFVLGPIMAIYLARFMKYLHDRGIANTDNRKVWAFCGDGEMDEPESLGAISLGGREKLDNLIFVINCNLQRLDGPVRGNGKIIQEMESVFRGSGWHVIKVIWGGNWLPIFQQDTSGKLLLRIAELVDGEWQSYSAKDGAYMREHFFGKYPELVDLVAAYSNEQLKELVDGGHDPQKVYAAYAAAVAHTGQPVVILTKTVKGYGLGYEGEGLNITHNLEEISEDGLKAFRDRFNLPLTDKQVEKLEFIKPKADSAEMKYLHAQRKALGGYIPSRTSTCPKLIVPSLDAFSAILEGSGERSYSSNMAFARVMMVLVRDKNLKKYLVPIVADEARTLAMEGLFRQLGIYAPHGQKYIPEDRKQLVYYREDKKGQLMQQGITEAGALATWIAAGTSYATNNLPMIPFYIYYAMFGYQRVGDLVWAAGDIKARGFLIGGLAGRTTLAGEGLQHQDSHNVLMFSFVPSCKAYDLCFSYEVAVLVQHGLQRMYAEQKDEFYYFTVMNESYQHPAMPKGAEKGIIKGMYDFKKSSKKSKLKVQLLGSGAILREVIQAAAILEKEYDVAADIWGVTSFNELRRDNDSVVRHNRLHPAGKAKQAYVTQCLDGREGPVIAATDYLRLFADQVRSAIPGSYHVLGTDGYGRSDSRANLRDFFEVNANMVVYTALKALVDEGSLDTDVVVAAAKKLNIDAKRPDPWTV
ncbi:MAG: pyruvate dehydrogenase (acetyl-transferring), homodimeric type [Coxiella sp. (in: Bacteria)]|nr:MAG: pyruvate dehydrogenase (acetyl-transferring), homodimeric type [Coxiella sp. (in: g-proteobacteria)]